jgi:N-acetylglucosamine-6-phosphate deacetylase
VRRLAQWTGEPARAIAAATVLPRRVLGDDRSLDQMLLGMPLAETLRWQEGPAGLSWQRPRAEVTP